VDLERLVELHMRLNIFGGLIDDEDRELNAETLSDFEDALHFDKDSQEVLHSASFSLHAAEKLGSAIELRYRDLHGVFLGSLFELLQSRNFLVVEVLDGINFVSTDLVGYLSADFELKAVDRVTAHTIVAGDRDINLVTGGEGARIDLDLVVKVLHLKAKVATNHLL
jgi:hypothetical protein